MQKNHPLLGCAQCRVVKPILRCPQICEMDRVSFGLACARRRTAHLQPDTQVRASRAKIGASGLRCLQAGSLIGEPAHYAYYCKLKYRSILNFP